MCKESIPVINGYKRVIMVTMREKSIASFKFEFDNKYQNGDIVEIKFGRNYRFNEHEEMLLLGTCERLYDEMIKSGCVTQKNKLADHAVDALTFTLQQNELVINWYCVEEVIEKREFNVVVPSMI